MSGLQPWPGGTGNTDPFPYPPPPPLGATAPKPAVLLGGDFSCVALHALRECTSEDCALSCWLTCARRAFRSALRARAADSWRSAACIRSSCACGVDRCVQSADGCVCTICAKLCAKCPKLCLRYARRTVLCKAWVCGMWCVCVCVCVCVCGVWWLGEVEVVNGIVRG